MTARIRFFEEAAIEVEEQRAWYRERSEMAEQSFLRELDHAIEIVSEAPHRWPAYTAGTRRYVFRKFPFSLVYFVEGDTLVIAAVEAENKEPGYWKSRLRKR